MKDRLQELAEIQRNRDLPPEYEETAFEFNQPRNTFLDDFFRQIEEIQQSIKGITDNVQRVKKMHSAILSAPQPDQGVKETLESTMEEIKKAANRVKASLKNMEKSIKDQESAGNGNYADIRIKRCQHATLSREFVDVMSEYNTIQNDYREKCKSRIKRHLAITGRTTDDEEFENMLESGNPSLFTQGIIVETQQAKQSLRDIEARHNDIIKLENSIKELHEMFTDMAILVQSQGEMINKIEYNIDQAAEYVQQGVSETKKAVKYRGKARRKKIIIIICILVLIGIIAGIIYAATR